MTSGLKTLVNMSRIYTTKVLKMVENRLSVDFQLLFCKKIYKVVLKELAHLIGWSTNLLRTCCLLMT